ncbi:hypothetical protein [Lysinibacter cavernae]|uniref:Uncharacterized protein n=1 Tax=Lysinibacter cavernae TaxID=1640652 RepID=A0A7X5TUA3_9MICO|nr:hypothetical protein [Lysinibacter cavernae]NIH55075.1 hypothetical protein [Lysinibacter cavernae]
MTFAADRRALRAARSVVAARAGRPSIADMAYYVYVGILAAAIAGSSVVRAIVLGLVSPAVAAGLQSPLAPGVVSAVVIGLAGVLLLLGKTRGPVVPRPDQVEFLAASPLPRWLSLRRSYLTSTAWLTAVIVVVAALLAVAAGLEFGAGPETVARWMLGAVSVGLLLSVVWLIGQRLPSWAAGLLAIAACMVAIASVLAGESWAVTPFFLPGALWADLAGLSEQPVAWAAVVTLCVIATVTFLGSFWLLNGLGRSGLAAQARRWQLAGMLAGSGDIAAAVGRLRPPPTAGRRLKIGMTGPFWAVVIQRDAVALLRFPQRLIVSASVLVAAGFLLSVSAGAPEGVRWAGLLVASALGYAAAGSLADGLRHGAAASGASTLFGCTIGRLLRASCVVPLAGTLVLGSIGVYLAAALAGASTSLFLWWSLLAVLWTLVRLSDAAKGPLPMVLRMPVPTPVGDVSILNVLLWQSDAVLIAILGATVTLLVSVGAPLTGIVLIAVVTAIVVGIVVMRVRKLSDTSL